MCRDSFRASRAYSVLHRRRDEVRQGGHNPPRSTAAPPMPAFPLEKAEAAIFDSVCGTLTLVHATVRRSNTTSCSPRRHKIVFAYQMQLWRLGFPGLVSLEPKQACPRVVANTFSYVQLRRIFRFVRGAILTIGLTTKRAGQPKSFFNPNQRSPLKLSVNFNSQERMFVPLDRLSGDTTMRYPMKHVFGAAAILAVAGTGNPVVAAELDRGSSITLAQAQQPAAPSPAPTAGAQEQPSSTSTTPGNMEHGKGMGRMGKEMGMGKDMGKGMGSTSGTPQCPAGQTASGTPPTCK